MSGTPQDDFDFYTVGTGERDFGGYFSDPDPTIIAPNLMARGTKNVYKKDRGSIAVRSGLKRLSADDDSDNPVVTTFEWSTSFGGTRVMRVLRDGQLQALYQGVPYLLGTYDKTRFVFSPWWSDVNEQEVLVMVNGGHDLMTWSGGIVQATGAVSDTALMVQGAAPVQEGGLVASLLSPSDAIHVGNNLLAAGSSRAAFVLSANPDVNAVASLAISMNTPFPSGTVNIAFVNAINPAFTSSSLTTILIGATPEATIANLLGFFQAPGSTTATHTRITNADVIAAIGHQTFSRVSSLTTGDGEPWRTNGFTDGYPDVGGTIEINGQAYPYVLVADQYLVGIGGAPPEGAAGTQGISVAANTPSGDFANDFIATITNQLIVGSYSSPTVYFSADTDYRDFSNTGDLISGDPDAVVLDELPRGVIVVEDSAYIPAGTGSWYICTPNTPVLYEQDILGDQVRLVFVKVQKKAGAAKTAALAHEFLGTLADTVVYLGQDHQLRMFGLFKDLLGTKFPTVSQAVKRELREEDFTGGALRAIEDRIYLTAPLSGRTYIYQERDTVDEAGNIVSERVWQPPQDWNVSRVGLVDDVIVGHSNQNPEYYQLWDTGQYHDDTSKGPRPYECVLRFGYWNFRDRTKKGHFNKAWIEGYTFPNTPLTLTMLSDYLGSTAIEQVQIGTDETSPALFTSEGQLIGDALIGTELLGGASGDAVFGELVPKFRAIAQFKEHDCFEYQPVLRSYAPDAYWEVLSIGTNGAQVINKPVELLRS